MKLHTTQNRVDVGGGAGPLTLSPEDDTLFFDETVGPTDAQVWGGFTDEDMRTLGEIISDARCERIEQRLKQEHEASVLAGRSVVLAVC